MNSLQSRKQLLLAESDLNRAQLAWDLAEMKAGLGVFTGRAKSSASVISSVFGLVSALVALRRNKSSASGRKTSWLQLVLKAAGLVSAAWLFARQRGRNLPDQ